MGDHATKTRRTWEDSRNIHRFAVAIFKVLLYLVSNTGECIAVFKVVVCLVVIVVVCIACILSTCLICMGNISRVPDQNGISRLYNMLEIYHSGRELLIWICVICNVCPASWPAGHLSTLHGKNSNFGHCAQTVHSFSWRLQGPLKAKTAFMNSFELNGIKFLMVMEQFKLNILRPF